MPRKSNSKPPSKRHSWQRDGHPWHHTKICVKCGCTKDTRSIGRTVYELNGQTFTNEAPPCEPVAQSDKIESE